MKVILKRAWSDGRATLGMLTVQGQEHDPIFTLENPERATSVDSRIPGGFYKCLPFDGARFKDVYQVMDVPGRTYILFHWGNYERDTLGCILLGGEAATIKGEPAILHSKDTFKKFRKLVGKKGFDLTIV